MPTHDLVAVCFVRWVGTLSRTCLYSKAEKLRTYTLFRKHLVCAGKCFTRYKRATPRQADVRSVFPRIPVAIEDVDYSRLSLRQLTSGHFFQIYMPFEGDCVTGVFFCQRCRRSSWWHGLCRKSVESNFIFVDGII